MTEDQIKHMVNRFLGWRLPKNFSPDAGISFKADFNEHTAFPMKNEPIGTNLFDATQADAMVRYLIEGMPGAAQQAVDCGEMDPPAKWLDEALRNLARELLADPKTPWIGDRDPKQHICWTAADRLLASSLSSTDGKSPQSFCGESDCTFQDGWCKCGMEG